MSNLKRIILFGGGAILGITLLLLTYFWFVLTWSYSNGERAGFVQKFSKKGWICKTWEGEQALISLPGTVPEKFYFTVRDETVAAHINQHVGKRVALVYGQHKGLISSCFGDTEYFVTDVKILAP